MQTGVERAPAPPQASYLAELTQAFWQRVGELLLRGGRALRLSAEAQTWIAAGLVALAVAALVWMLLALLRRRRQATLREAGAAGSGPVPTVAAWDAEAWRAELERCLSEERSEERIGEALRAAWWWLARSIAGPEAEPDWTSRDLLARTRKRELRDLLRRLDALTFGADRPGLADLRRLAEQIRGALV